jgi:nitrogen fixation protein NifU and related proteins
MDALYRDYILDHYKRPRNFGELEPHDLEFHDHNPLCGDDMGVHIRLDDEGRIAEIAFHGQGCAISQASASIASEEYLGMSVDGVPGLSAGWMIDQLGIEISATRRKCALLNLKVMRGATSDDASWPGDED